MSITAVRYFSGPTKPKPKVGDLKTIKGVLHRREFERTNIGTPNCPCFARNKTGGRYHYKWVPVEQPSGDPQ